MCLCCYPIIKKSGPNVKEEPPATPLAREERFRSISRPTQRCSHRVDLALAYIISYSSLGVTITNGCDPKIPFTVS